MVAAATRALLRDGALLLAAAGIARPAREARWIGEYLVGGEAGALGGGAVPDAVAFAALISRRVAHEPLAYLLGTAPFRDLMLAVSPATLIPRGDSETLIEAAVAELPDRDRVRAILDLGTGTGCLLLAALGEYPGAFGVGVDRVAAACALARANAARTGLAGRAAFVCGDWGAALAGRFDLILSNPPYIPSADIAGLMPEVARHEPRTALDGGADGLDAYRTLLGGLDRLLAPAGVAIYELGAGQADAVGALAGAHGWAVSLYRDPGGHRRALVARRGLAK